MQKVPIKFIYKLERIIKVAWKTTQTINAKKNSMSDIKETTIFVKDGYRFKLVNQGTKEKIEYSINFVVLGDKNY